MINKLKKYCDPPMFNYIYVVGVCVCGYFVLRNKIACIMAVRPSPPLLSALY
jgi:hypothetical protein